MTTGTDTSRDTRNRTAGGASLEEAVTNGARIRVIYGPPGTGKTRTLHEKAEEAARKWGPRAVMVTSMTRAAAHEVRERASSGFGAVLPETQVATLHSWARAALGSVGEHVASKLSDWNERHRSFRIRKGFFDDGLGFDPTTGERCLTRLSLARARMDDWRSGEGLSKLAHEFATAWDAWKQEGGYTDFDDWIELARTEETSPPPGVRLIYVDEAQDHCPSELALIAHWAQQCDGVVLLGDPDQSIHTFRGADPSVFLAIPQEFKRTLEQSYRVPATVHRYAQKWIRRIGDRREDLVYNPRDEEGECRRVEHAFRRDAVRLARRARRHYEEGETCLFLAPSRATLGPLLKALKNEGLPVGNPYAPHRGDLNPTRGLGVAKAFYAMRPELAHDDRQHVWTWEELWRFFQHVDKRHLERGVKTHLKALAKGAETKDQRVAATPEGAWATLDAFLDVEEGPRTLQALQRLYSDSKIPRLTYGRRIDEKTGAHALAEEPRVWVGTIHSVKGGQADHVYVSPDLGGFREQWEEGGRSGRDDLLRLYYVAFTRAREALYLCAPSRRYGRGAIEW